MFAVIKIMDINIKFLINYLIVIAVITISFVSLFDDISKKPEIDQLGKPATTGEFPYHVSIEYDGRHECSGALISEKHVLTSGMYAHHFKVNNRNQSKVQVLVGSTNVPGGTPYAVEDINHHPEYNKITLKNNVAVIRLIRNVLMSKSIRPAELPKANHKLFFKQQLLVTGFPDARSLPPPTKAELTKIYIYYADNATCREIFYDQDLTKMFCAHVAPEYSSCGRNIGDPVTENKKNIIGIYSNNPGDCSDGSYNLFTYVPSYLKFIQSQMNIAD